MQGTPCRMGGRLTIAAASESVAADAVDMRRELAPGPYVRIAISDTGIGMDEATLKQAIEPFTTKGPGTGSGLGLPIVRNFAEQSGGAFHIESTPDIGTTVTLWLPAQTETHSSSS